MQSPESPTANTRPAHQVVLLYAAIAFAGLSAFQATQGSVAGLVLFGVLALFAFATSQVLAQRPLIAGLGASITGAAVGTYLTFFLEKAEDFCGTSGWSDCGKVLNPETSPWAEIYGLPTSLIACAFFTGLSVLLVQAIRTEKTEAANTLMLLAGVGATSFSAFLAYQSKMVLGEWCAFCISLYAVSLTLLAVGLSATKKSQPVGLKEALMGSGRSLSGTGLIAGLIVIAIGPTGEDAHGDHDHTPSGIDELYTEIDATISITGREPSKGSVQAEWTVVEFTDYTCGHCADQAPIIQKVVQRHPKMKLLHKHYAFINDSSKLAARAAVCAHQQGRFWEMNSALFDNMKEWNPEDLTFLAKARANVSEEDFAACLANDAMQASVEADYEAGERAGVRGTPAFYIAFDGKTWLKVEGGADAVDLLLSAAEQGTAFPGLTIAGTGTPE